MLEGSGRKESNVSSCRGKQEVFLCGMETTAGVSSMFGLKLCLSVTAVSLLEGFINILSK